MKINIGSNGKQQISFDLDVLLRTRLLIQANSGGGKSYLLRRIAEQAFGKVQVIIIDPEGEFLTLREKYDYVLVGKGGETPADTRSAALVAHKLLELNASAVCDLYEMKASERHRWVKLFIEAMIDAPKKLWHPVLVIVDEAHTFCPEKGAGESEASDAMIGLATRGRKRGFCAVFATQRLGKLRKDAAAELLNILVGQTFIDVDRKRAAESLGISAADLRSFFDEIKVVAPGHFWALGRAISTERVLVDIGKVETTHAEPGSSKHAAAAPPAPAKIQSLLPKLSDLPKEAEQKAKTEQDLRADILQLKKELAARPAAQAERVEIPVFKDGELERFEEAVRILDKAGTEYTHVSNVMGPIAREISQALNTAKQIKAVPGSSLANLPFKKVSGERLNIAKNRKIPLPTTSNLGDEVKITDPQQRILDSISWLESVNLYAPKRTVVAFLSEQSPTSSGFTNNLGRLRSLGMINYPNSESLELTEQGRAQTRSYDQPISPDEVQRAILSRLPKPQANILQVLINAYRDPVNRVDLAEQAGQSPTSSGFTNNLGALRSLGVIEYPNAESARALPVLFLE
jgi:hypothetical protein